MNKEKSITLVVLAAAAPPLSWGVGLDPIPYPAQKQMKEFSKMLHFTKSVNRTINFFLMCFSHDFHFLLLFLTHERT